MLMRKKNIVRLLLFILLMIDGVFLFSQEVRDITGYNNNIENPLWGNKDSYFLKLTENGFGDGIKSLSGENRPNARLISNIIFEQQQAVPDELQLTAYNWAFGQFIDHDINLVGVDYSEPIFVKVPEGDKHFTPGSSIHVFRTIGAEGTGTSIDNPRSFKNEITSFIDASNVYGSDSARNVWLRTFKDGKLKISDGDLLPWNTFSGQFNDKIDPHAPELANDTQVNDKLFVAGDIRANENPLLLALHTLFVREHNRLCDEIKSIHPDWNDEKIYQLARKYVGAYLQSIVYYEWLPMQGINLPEYSGYNPEINPGISNLFSAAAFRLGHSQIGEILLRLDNDNNEIIQGNLNLKDAFFNPLLINFSGGIEPFLKGMNIQIEQKLDTKMVGALRNYLFGDPDFGGLDLAAINIMRSRERGIPDYNTIRANFGLEKIEDFSQITSDSLLANQLKFLYGNVDNIDAWVGLLAEDHVENTIFGPLLKIIIEDQFIRLRDGDRFYFENDPGFSSEEIEKIKNTKFHDIIMRNTDLEYMPKEVFTQRKVPLEGPHMVHLELFAKAYPNPVKDVFTVKTWVEDDIDINLNLIDPQGKLIWSKNEIMYSGENFIENIDLSGYSKGLYNLILKSDKTINILKIIKQ